MEDLHLAPVTEEDLEVLVAFFAAPHVERWWHEVATLENLRATTDALPPTLGAGISPPSLS